MVRPALSVPVVAAPVLALPDFVSADPDLVAALPDLLSAVPVLLSAVPVLLSFADGWSLPSAAFLDGSPALPFVPDLVSVGA